jgi:hypothetical protein
MTSGEEHLPLVADGRTLHCPDGDAEIAPPVMSK